MVFARFTRGSVLAGVLLAAACSSGSGPRVPPSGGPEIGALHVPWKDKNREEKQAYMAAHVEPMMGKLFQKFNKKGYAEFGCATCHGENAERVGFHMPNGLVELDTKDPVADGMNIDEETGKFMVEEVLPTMSRLLSKTDEHGKPVTCLTCHPGS